LITPIYESDLSLPCSISPTGFACKLNVVNHTSYVPSVTINGLNGAGSAIPESKSVISIILLRAYPPMPV
jgi:hypothetical protein